MTKEEVRASLVAAKTSIEDAVMYITNVRKDPVARANLEGVGSLDMAILELSDQRDYLMQTFNIGQHEHGYL